jgi:type VI secretion system secreted protein VgrG
MRDRALLESKTLGPCRVVALRAVEAMNALPRWTLDVLLGPDEPDLDAVIGSPAFLFLVGDEELDPPRAAELIVTDVDYTTAYRDGHIYRVELSAAPWLLTLRSGYRIFQNQTTQQIVASLFDDAGLGAPHVDWRLTGTYFERVHCTQYGETTWAFVERLLADEGISYWFDFDSGSWTIVFADHASGHPTIDGDPAVLYSDPAGALHGVGAIHELELTCSWAHTSTHVRAYDVDHPDVMIEGREGSGPFEHYEFPVGARNAAAAAIRATVRLEQLQRFQVSARAVTGCARLQPGRTFTLEGAADEEHGQSYLVVEARHDLVESTPDHTTASPYRGEVLLVPAGKTAFRPDLPRAAPRIEGIETAVTKGPAGEEIHVDELGRVKLEMRWDPAGIPDDRSSSWIRCAQNNLAGSMILPRVGWEVAVAYDQGDPDRPLVLGRLYNPTTAVPYGLPAAKATSAYKSNTSPGGGSVNEILLADDAGSQSFAVTASRDLSLQVGGDSSWKVGAKAQHGVDLGHEASVHGTLSASIGANLSITSAKHYRLVVNGLRLILVGGADIVSTSADRTLGIKAAYVELIGGFHGIQCNQENTAVMGSFTQVVGGVLAQTVGLGTGETVAGLRVEAVAGPRLIFTKMAASEGGKFCTSTTIKAGGSVDDGPKAVELKCKAGGTIKAGTASLSAGSEFVIECEELELSAPKIEVEDGPKLVVAATTQASGGKTKVDATNIKKTSGVEAEA